MISAAAASLTGPRTSVTSSRVSSAIGNASYRRPAPTRRDGPVSSSASSHGCCAKATYSAGAIFPATLALRDARHSSKRRTTTKNDGTNSTARQVEASMPLNTAMPIDLRELAPAPVASTSGSTPRIKANEVIRIGRKRARAASVAASMIRLAVEHAPLARHLDDQDRVLRREC